MRKVKLKQVCRSYRRLSASAGEPAERAPLVADLRSHGPKGALDDARDHEFDEEVFRETTGIDEEKAEGIRSFAGEDSGGEIRLVLMPADLGRHPLARCLRDVRVTV